MYFTIAVLIYLSLVLGYYFFQKEKSVYKTKEGWLKNGFSLFAVNFSITTPLLYSGVMHSEGVAGLWLYWAAFLTAGVSPFIFAPLWARLNFLSDNQFILLRFSGIGAKVLHLFRTVYVGWLIIAFLMSFQLLAFFKVLVFYTGWNKDLIFFGFAIFLLLITFKNRLSLNINLDYFHTILMSIVFIACVLFFKFYSSNAIEVNTSKMLSPVLPLSKTYLFVIVFVQSWSVCLFDSSGIQAQRFFSTKSKSNVAKVALVSVGLNLLFTLIFVYLNYRGSQIFNLPKISDNESYILSYLQQGIPNWFFPIVLISMVAIFITSFEGLLNWGSSYLTIDGYETYLKKKASKSTSILFMIFIVLSSLTITYFSNSIKELTQILFSISAGVGPVFVLRWFWKRINAWSQLTAMISSGVFTLVYQYFFSNTALELNYMKITNLNEYSLKLIFVTTLTTLCWLAVTFLTKQDSQSKIEEFQNLTEANYNLLSNVVKAIFFGFIIVLSVYFTITLFLI